MLTTKIYKATPPIARHEAEAVFSSGSSEQISDALVRVALNDPDWRWVQEKCLTFINSSTPDVRRVAITCLGHLARIHGTLDRERVLPLLNNLMDDEEVSGTVEDTLDDVERFTGTEKQAMVRFSSQTEQVLRAAGWFPGRQVPDLVKSWKGEAMLSEFQMFPSAERFLLEFGAIEVDQSGPGETCAREPFAVDPTLAGYEGDSFSEFSPLVSTNLYPLGEAFGGTYFWAIGEDDQFYILMDDILLLGKNPEEALENLILGRMPQKIA